MAVKIFWLQNVILNLFFTFVSVNSSKLNVPRVLLPVFNNFSAKFTLEATEGGCYKWSTTRNDIIQITPLEEDIQLRCSTKVIISTITKEAARNIAVVLAEDVHTKQMLRCDVIVDAIHSLSISTTTKELFMEEAPEDFEVKAYDDQKNEFSTLEGIEFEWNIVPLGPTKDAVLRYITFRESPYETPPAIAPLENAGKKGYSILLEGVKSGAAKVTVRLPYPEYKQIVASEVHLMVVANLLITPPEAYAMVGDAIPFKIFFLNSGRMEEVTLPNKQYYLEAEDTKLASSTKKTGDVVALKEGKTRVVLRDKNVGKDDPALKLPAANLYIVSPDYLVINVLPHKNWAILVGDHHDIAVEVYSSTDHKLFLGGSVHINVEIAPEFHVLSRSKNGTWLTGYGVKSSIVTVVASLEEIYHEKTGRIIFQKPLTARGDLMIYPRISLSPSEVILPWDPITRPKYDVDLIVKGGDGRFLWTSSDNAIGLVSQTGHVRTHSNGFFEVSAVMLRNHHNRQSAKFIILPPSRLEIVEFVMENEIGSPVYLHIALYAEQEKDGTTIQLPFTKCQSLPFHIKQSDAKFRHNKTAILPPVGISCGNIAMTALEVGTSKITVTYFQDGRALEDSVSVSSYNPLRLLEPRRDIVLAIGTTINLVYIGGPRPILGRAVDHQRVVVSEDEKIVKATDVSQHYSIPGEDFSVVQVLCRKLGETDIKLMISNMPAAANCKSQTSSITTRVTCGKPRKITLQPELRVADVDACPMDLSSGNVVVQSTKSVDLEVAVYDDCGTRFLNITSFNFEWKVTPAGKGKLLNKNGVFPKNLTVGNVPVAHKNYQTLEPTVDIGNLEINVTIIGYNSKILGKYRVTPEFPPFMTEEDRDNAFPPIRATLALYLVDSTVLTPSIVTLYNHPGNKQIVSVKQGSGYFELALSADDLATVRYTESTKEIEIIPIKSGELTVQVIDLCLVSRPATLMISIVSVGIIRVEMPDKVEVGKCIPCIVRLYDENDNLMAIPDPGMIDLRPEFENKIANIHRAEKPEKKGKSAVNLWGLGEVHYTITGVTVGDSKLVFTVSGADEDINSAPIDLQVFDPLRLFPRNGSVLIGSIFQLTVKGGPQPDTNIAFDVLTPTIARVSERGVITGLAAGITKLSAQSIGIHPSTGQSVIYSEDVVEIQVVELKSVRLMGPLTRFRVGTTAPFWCWGVPDVSPMILGTLQDPPIFFKWSVDDKLLVDLSGVFHPVGVFKKKPDRVAIKVFGLQPGKTRLFVNTTVPGRTAGRQSVDTVMLSSFLDIEVITEFSLIAPEFPGRSLLMAPFSQIQLKTNLEGPNINIVYWLPGNHAPSTELLADQSVTPSGIFVTISPTGLLQSYGTLGHALLIVISTDEQGLKQRLSIVVEVKPIHYMNLNVVANWRIHSDSPLRTIPLGSEFLLKATFHDNLGNKFHAGPKDLKVRTSRCDLLKIVETTESAVRVYTKKPGSTMLKAWADGIQKTTDYARINVEQSVRPILDHLTSGDIICLWTPVVSEYNAPGTWRSSDNDLIMINPALDIGFVGNKEGIAILTHSFLQSAPIQIDIFPVSIIEWLNDPFLVLTNGDANSVVRVILVLQSLKSVGLKTNNLIQGWRCRTDVRKLVSPTGFRCFMKFSNESISVGIDQLFNITNSWVPDTGQYACKFINLGVHASSISVLSTNVTLWATTEDYEVESEHLNIKFFPNVYAPLEVYLKENTNTGDLIVIGLPEVLAQLSVTPADSSIIYVDAGKSINQTAASYHIQLIDYHWRLAELEDAMGIIVSSPITKQNFKVIVKVTGDKHVCGVPRSPLLAFLQNYKYAIVMATAMMFIFFLTFYFYSNFMHPIVNVNVNPARSLLTTPTAGGGLPGSPTGSPTQCPGANLNPRCAANRSRLGNLNSSPSNRGQAVCCGRFNCSCSQAGREPIYGDASSFYSSPEVRRNRRGM